MMKINKLAYRLMSAVVLLALTFGSYASAGASSAPIVAASANTYYVSVAGNDANAGTQAQPWKTIQKCANTASDGAVCSVAAGTYPETVRISKDNITIRCEQSRKCTVKKFEVWGSGNTIEGFVINGGTITGVDVRQHNNTIRDVEITDIKIGSGDANGIVLFGTGHIFDNIYIHDIDQYAFGTPHQDCFQTWRVDSFGGAASYITITNVICDMPQAGGSFISKALQSSGGSHDWVVKNLISNAPMACLFYDEAYNIDISYSTFIGSGIDKPNGCKFLKLTTAPAPHNNNVTHSIFQNITGTSPLYDYVTGGHNCYWQTTGRTPDTGDIFANPLLRADWSVPANSPCAGMGAGSSNLPPTTIAPPTATPTASPAPALPTVTATAILPTVIVTASLVPASPTVTPSPMPATPTVTSVPTLEPDPATPTTAPIGIKSVDVRVVNGESDVEESSTGKIYLNNTNLELVNNGSVQKVGIRFLDVGIPQGATIVNAYIQFKSGKASTDATTLSIQGDTSANAPAFANTIQNVSLRPRTTGIVNWSPSPWTKARVVGPAQLTPNLAPIIQEIISQPGWASGNSMVIIITGSGKRVAKAYEGDAAGAPLLHIEYITDMVVSNIPARLAMNAVVSTELPTTLPATTTATPISTVTATSQPPTPTIPVTFTFPCILTESTSPENWQIPLKLSPAPKDYATPGVEVGVTFVSSNPKFILTSSPTFDAALFTPEPYDPILACYTNTRP